MGNWFKSDQHTSMKELKQHELDYGDLFMRYLKEKKHNENGHRNRESKTKPEIKHKQSSANRLIR